MMKKHSAILMEFLGLKKTLAFFPAVTLAALKLKPVIPNLFLKYLCSKFPKSSVIPNLFQDLTGTKLNSPFTARTLFEYFYRYCSKTQTNWLHPFLVSFAQAQQQSREIHNSPFTILNSFFTKLNSLFTIHNSLKKHLAFSLIELLISLIAISCITAAFAPVISKKLATSTLSIGAGVAAGTFLDPDECASIFNSDCMMCTKDICASCDKICASGTYRNSNTCTCESCSAKFGVHCTVKCSKSECSMCQAGFYLSGKKKECIKCPNNRYCDGSENVLTCKDAFGAGCTSCNTNGCTGIDTSSGQYYLNNNKSHLCSNIQNCNSKGCNKSGCTNCNSGYYLKNSLTCTRCNSIKGCIPNHCTPQSNSCTGCSATSHYFLGTNGQCSLTRCNTHFVLNQLTCTETRCPTHFVRSGLTCTETRCPTHFVRSNLTCTETRCPTHFVRSNLTCTETRCPTHFVRSGLTCAETRCPAHHVRSGITCTETRCPTHFVRSGLTCTETRCGTHEVRSGTNCTETRCPHLFERLGLTCTPPPAWPFPEIYCYGFDYIHNGCSAICSMAEGGYRNFIDAQINQGYHSLVVCPSPIADLSYKTSWGMWELKNGSVPPYRCCYFFTRNLHWRN